MAKRKKTSSAKKSSKSKKTTAKKTTKKTTKAKKTTRKISKQTKTSKISKSVSRSSRKTSTKSKKIVKTSESTKKIKKKNYSEIDRDFIELMKDEKQIFIEDLIIKLEITDDEAKKAIKRLEAKGKIISRSVMEAGKWAIQITIVDNYGLEINKKKNGVNKLIWDTCGNIPCFCCPQIKKCSDGQEHLNPQFCDPLTEYLNATLNNEPYTSPFLGCSDDKKKKRSENVEEETEAPIDENL